MNQAAQTIRDELNYNGQYCLFTCHFGNENKQHDDGEKMVVIDGCGFMMRWEVRSAWSFGVL